MRQSQIKSWMKLLAIPLGYKDPTYGSCFGPHEAKYAEFYKWLKRSLSIQGGILEFGVASGGTTCLLAEYLKSHNSSKTIDSFDSFIGFDPIEFDADFDNGHVTNPSEKTAFQTTEFSFNYVRLKLKAYGLADTVSLHKGFFEKSLPQFLLRSDQPFSFALIDCDLASSVRFCANLIYPYMSQNGIILFDDYASLELGKPDTAYSPGVQLVVDEFVTQHMPLAHGYNNGLYHFVKPDK